jgi:hypothetical protein
MLALQLVVVVDVEVLTSGASTDRTPAALRSEESVVVVQRDAVRLAKSLTARVTAITAAAAGRTDSSPRPNEEALGAVALALLAASEPFARLTHWLFSE